MTFLHFDRSGKIAYVHQKDIKTRAFKALWVAIVSMSRLCAVSSAALYQEVNSLVHQSQREVNHGWQSQFNIMVLVVNNGSLLL